MATCADCKFSRPTTPSVLLECRHYAPAPMPATIGESQQKRQGWPLCLPTDWCGDWVVAP